jgi:tRNA nucleotidyltransferase (CCA-adding enzyme)
MIDLMERLNLRSDQRKIIRGAHQIRFNKAAIIAAEKAGALYQLLAATTNDARLVAWIALQGEDDALCRQLVRYQTQLRDIAPIIDGHYLKTEFGLKPGPIYRTILDALREARLDGLVNTLDDERTLVEKILAEHDTNGK